MTRRSASWTPALVCVLVAVGCGSRAAVAPPHASSAPPVVAPPSAPPYVAAPAALPGRLAAAPVQTVCSRAVAVAAAPPPKPREYDFQPIPLALAYGPTPETQWTTGFRRDDDAIRAAIFALRPRLVACVRRGLGARPPLVATQAALEHGLYQLAKLALTIDPFGRATEVAVEAPPSIAGCLREALATIQVEHRTPRHTRVAAELLFSQLRDATPLRGARLSAAPATAPADARPGCMRALVPVPVDTTDLATLVIDASQPEDTSPRDSPRVMPYFCVDPDVDKVTIREAIRANLGALRGCYVAAAARQPGLAGTVTTRFVLDGWGVPTLVDVHGDGDGALHACVKDALALAVTSARPQARTTVNLPFALVPGRAPITSAAEADAALAAGDLDGVAAFHAASAARAPDDAAACRARLGIVRAYAAVPGGPDDRTAFAIDAFARFVAGRPRDRIAACVAEAVPVLGAIARWPVRPGPRDLQRWRGAGLAEALDRASAMAALLPELDGELLPFIADALSTLDRHEEARARYLELFGRGGYALDVIKRAAEGYARSSIWHARSSPVLPSCALQVRY